MPYELLDQGDPNETQAQVPVIDVPTTDRPSSGTMTVPAGQLAGPPEQATPWDAARRTTGQLYSAALDALGRWREELQPDPNRTYPSESPLSGLIPWSWGTVDRSDPGHPALPAALRYPLIDMLTPPQPGHIWGVQPGAGDSSWWYGAPDEWGGSMLSPGGGLIASYMGPRTFGKPNAIVPGVSTSEAAKNIARAWYQRASMLGGNLTARFTNNFLDDAAATINPAREITTGPTEMTGLLSRWNAAYRNKPLTLNDIQAMDEGLGDLIDKHFDPKTGLDKDGLHLLDVQTALRQKIAGAGEGDVVGSKAGFDALVTGRQAWSQAMKMQDIERIQRRANMTDNPSGSVITQVKNLITNHAKSRGYFPDEMEALEDAASRGVLGGVMHRLGGRLWTMVGTGVGSSIGGAPGAILGGMVGDIGSTAARNWATAIALRKMQNAFDVLGQRVPPDPLNFGPP